MTLNNDIFAQIFEAYGIADKVESAGEIGSGHINKTFCLTGDFGARRKMVMQQINTFVFRKPVELMANVVAVTDYMRERIIARGGDPERETLNVIPTASGESYVVCSDGSVWRMYNYIADSRSYDIIDRPGIFRKAGEAFGSFMSELADFPIDSLYDTIPFFHDTGMRLSQLKEAVANDAAGRLKEVQREVDFCLERADDTRVVTDMIASGDMPLRVTHNDTKLNNIMFDAATDEPLCIVDLDTVMPGSCLYDFGDAIRFGASTAAEDERDLLKVNLSLPLYKEYLEGFLASAGTSLTPAEREYLPFSAKLLTLECGMRFLADHLNGDTYFGAAYPGHNLVRARTQFKLVSDMEARFDEMKDCLTLYD